MQMDANNGGGGENNKNMRRWAEHKYRFKIGSTFAKNQRRRKFVSLPIQFWLFDLNASFKLIFARIIVIASTAIIIIKKRSISSRGVPEFIKFLHPILGTQVGK